MNVFENANNMARPKDADDRPLSAYNIVAEYDSLTYQAIEHGGKVYIVRKRQPDTGLSNALPSPARTTSDHVAHMNARNKAFWGNK